MSYFKCKLECECLKQMNFRLTTVEIIRQQKGCSSSLRLQISALTCDECGAIPWDELQVYSLSFITSFHNIFVYIVYLYTFQSSLSIITKLQNFIHYTFDMKSCVHFAVLFVFFRFE